MQTHNTGGYTESSYHSPPRDVVNRAEIFVSAFVFYMNYEMLLRLMFILPKKNFMQSYHTTLPPTRGIFVQLLLQHF